MKSRFEKSEMIKHMVNDQFTMVKSHADNIYVRITSLIKKNNSIYLLDNLHDKGYLVE